MAQPITSGVAPTADVNPIKESTNELRDAYLSLPRTQLGGRAMYLATLDPTTKGTCKVRVNTDALLDLQSRGFDLSQLTMMINNKSWGPERQFYVTGNPTDPMQGEIKIAKQFSNRRDEDHPTSEKVDARGYNVYTSHDKGFALVWIDPESSPQRRVLAEFPHHSPFELNTRFDAQGLLDACRLQNGEPLTAPAYRSLPTDGLTGKISDAKSDHVVTADEVVGILAEAKAGGTNPTKVKAVLDLYEKTPTASWANPSIKSKQTVIDTLGTTKLRDFLLLHHSMLPADKRGDDLVDLQTLPLPKPPANVENVLEYTYGANVHFVGYKPENANRVHAYVSGGDVYVEQQTSGGDTFVFKGAASGAGTEGLNRMQHLGTVGYGSSASRFRVHELERDSDGKVTKLSISWVSQGSGTFGRSFGRNAGHVVLTAEQLEAGRQFGGVSY